MSIRTRLRQVLVVLGAAGSLAPGWGAPTGRLAPPVAPVVADGGRAVTSPRLATVRSPDVPGPRRTWSWPLAPRPAVLSPFVAPRSTYGAGHRGIDVEAAQGQSVVAVDAGLVTHVGVIAGRGTVSVTHASGLRSTYEPVHGILAAGSTVAEGQAIGTVAGRTHCGASCLHLGALRGPGYVDPRPLLGGGPVILLPLLPSR